MRYPHLAARIFNTPLLIHPRKLDAIVAGLGPRLLGAELLSDGDIELSDLPLELFSTRRGERSDGGYRNVDGVAVLQVMGALAHRSKMEADSSYILGYNEVATKLENAMNDPAVHAVAAIVDSPGGEAQGAFELAQRTFEFRGKKPMVAVADGMAASAAYLFASAAEHIVVTDTGYAGSIGVAMRHVDISRLLANQGIHVESIFAGENKIDGNPYEKLPPRVRADFQAEVDKLYGMFVAAVARNTGMTADAVRATQARTYMGEAAVRAGLASRLASTDQILTELAGLRARTYAVGQSARVSSANDKGATMSGNTTAADGSQSATQPPAHASAVMEGGIERVRAETRTEERTRIKSILALSMPGHEALVQKLAFESETSAGDAALQVLAAEKEARSKQASNLAADAPQVLALRPAATVRNEGAEPPSRAEIDKKAKDYVAAHPGTTYVQAVKIFEQQGA